MKQQKILHGIDNLPKIFHQIDIHKILLVCGHSFSQLGIDTDAWGVEVVKFSDFTPNPLFEQVEQGIKLLHSTHCDAIIAIGGGSAIDVAKCIKLFHSKNPHQALKKQTYSDTGTPLIAVPTTAGTGSESTRYAVVYLDGEKQSISHESIIPHYAILDSALLRTLPVYQKKCAMLDALCQGIESYWSIHATPVSRKYAEMAITKITKHWRQYLAGDDESAGEILLAANFSGRAINITATTAPHAMSYKLTNTYHLPHGHAVAICLPEVWAYILQNSDQPTGQILNKLSALIDIDNFRSLLQSLEITYPHSDNRLADLDLLTDSVNPVRLKNNPVPLDREAIYNIYERIIK